jgi:hypothetical protein
MNARNPFGQKNDGGWAACSACGRRFGSLSGFDAHRRDITKDPHDWRCATDAELAAGGYALDGRGFWRQVALESFWSERQHQEPRSAPTRPETPGVAA